MRSISYQLCILLTVVFGLLKAPQARQRANEVIDDIRAEPASKLVDMCRAMAAEHSVENEALFAGPGLIVWSSDLILSASGNWSFVEGGDAARGSESESTTRQVARDEKEGGASRRRHLSVAENSWHLSLQQYGGRSPNVGWVAGSLALRNLSEAQVAGLGVPPPVSGDQSALPPVSLPTWASCEADHSVCLSVVGLLYPQGDAPGGNICLLGCAPPTQPAPVSDDEFMRNYELETRLFNLSYLQSSKCTVRLQLHYTAEKLSLRGLENGSLGGILRRLPTSPDGRPFLRLSTTVPAFQYEVADGMSPVRTVPDRVCPMYVPTMAARAPQVCSDSASARPSYLAKFGSLLFRRWEYPPAKTLQFRIAERELHARLLCDGYSQYGTLRGKRSEAMVNRNLFPPRCNDAEESILIVPVNDTLPISGLFSARTEPRRLRTVTLLLSRSAFAWEGNKINASSEALVGEGTYDRRTGKLCLLACLVPDFAEPDEAMESTVETIARLLRGDRASMGNPMSSATSAAAADAVGEAAKARDCEILITIQYPRILPWVLAAMRAPLIARVASIRDPKDPQFFTAYNFTVPEYGQESRWKPAMAAIEVWWSEVFISFIAVLLILLQTRHLKEHPAAARHVSLYFVAAQVIGAALLLLSALLPARYGTSAALFFRFPSDAELLINAELRVLQPILGAIWLIAYAHLMLVLLRLRGRGQGLTRVEEAGSMELLRTAAWEKREREDPVVKGHSEGGGGGGGAAAGGSGHGPLLVPIEAATAAAAAAAIGTEVPLAAREWAAFLLCSPLYVTLLLDEMVGTVFNGEENGLHLWAVRWSRDITRCSTRWMRGSAARLLSCLFPHVLSTLGLGIRDLVLVPQLALALHHGAPGLEGPPLSRPYAYGILLCELALHGLNSRRVTGLTYVGGPLCLGLQLVYLLLQDATGRKKGAPTGAEA